MSRKKYYHIYINLICAFFGNVDECGCLTFKWPLGIVIILRQKSFSKF